MLQNLGATNVGAQLMNRDRYIPGRAGARGIALLALLLGAGAAFADDSQREVEVTVWTIRASKTSDEISKELRPVVRELKQRFNYKGFKLEKKSEKKLKLDQSSTTALIGDFRAEITPKSVDGNRIKLEIEVLKREKGKIKRLLRTTVTSPKSRFHLQGGWQISDDNEDVLIIGVAAR